MIHLMSLSETVVALSRIFVFEKSRLFDALYCLLMLCVRFL